MIEKRRATAMAAGYAEFLTLLIAVGDGAFGFWKTLDEGRAGARYARRRNPAHTLARSAPPSPVALRFSGLHPWQREDGGPESASFAERPSRSRGR